MRLGAATTATGHPEAYLGKSLGRNSLHCCGAVVQLASGRSCFILETFPGYVVNGGSPSDPAGKQWRWSMALQGPGITFRYVLQSALAICLTRCVCSPPGVCQVLEVNNAAACESLCRAVQSLVREWDPAPAAAIRSLLAGGPVRFEASSSQVRSRLQFAVVGCRLRCMGGLHWRPLPRRKGLVQTAWPLQATLFTHCTVKRLFAT